jgi:DNA gyrase subunit B
LNLPSTHNGIRKVSLGRDLMKNDDMTRLVDLYKKVETKGRPPFVLKKGDKSETVASREELVEQAMGLGQKGLNVNRYKGLGEMNPDQLWETTMDPEKRTLLQVRIEDAVESDEIFTVLMGDKVEPRREFIQENALKVRELDI